MRVAVMSHVAEYGFMRTDRPLVSVIVQCYNHARFVVECLESVRAQSYPNVDLIVIDDCSKDDSRERIRAWLAAHAPTARFVAHERNAGVCRTLNDAVEMVRGEYVCMTAADDIWEPTLIEQHVDRLEHADADVAVAYSDATVIDEHGNVLPTLFIERAWPSLQPPSGRLLSHLSRRNFIPSMAATIRMRALREVGSYDEALHYEDWDMWLRLARRYRFVYHDGALARYRILGNSLARTLFTSDQNIQKFETGARIALKVLSFSELDTEQRRYWERRLSDDASQLYRLDAPVAPSILRRAAWRLRTPRLGLLATAATLGVLRAFGKRVLKGFERRVRD
jgi:glycosyltransferase involved in cell wall biosynthesis